MTLTHAHSAALWRLIRAAYEGRDPARPDRASITVEALAAAFGVHANTIFGRCKSRQWRRPAWYVGVPTGPRVRQTAAQQRRDRLLALFRQAASAGAPCPTEAELKAVLCVAGRTVRGMITGLCESGALRMETGSYKTRRAILADGAATDWSGRKRNPRVMAVVRKISLVKPEPVRLPAARPRSGVTDLGVRDAVRALQRRGLPTFDVGIHTGAWCERWNVAGKTVTRSGLLAEAARA